MNLAPTTITDVIRYHRRLDRIASKGYSPDPTGLESYRRTLLEMRRFRAIKKALDQCRPHLEAIKQIGARGWHWDDLPIEDRRAYAEHRQALDQLGYTWISSYEHKQPPTHPGRTNHEALRYSAS